jgi:hypothetical protein
MKTTRDHIARELRRLDPIRPWEVDDSVDGGHAVELLDRILGMDAAPADVARELRPRRRRTPMLIAAGAALGAAAVVMVLISLPGGSSDRNRLVGALDAAATASSRSGVGAVHPYTYLKTREVAVKTAGADQHSWQVYQATTREEWVSEDGQGGLRLVADPSRFVDGNDRVAWESAGRPSFLTLGFGRHTEDHWLAGGAGNQMVEELPAEPVALATHLRYEAEVGGRSNLPLSAAMLGLIAEDLRSPAASPALRGALYETAKRLPGIEYFGEATDPAGRSGVAIGITEHGAEGGGRRYSLIFDPRSGRLLASETIGDVGTGSPRIVRAAVYLASHPIPSMSASGGTWLTGFQPTTAWQQSPTSFLVYRISPHGATASTMDADARTGAG